MWIFFERHGTIAVPLFFQTPTRFARKSGHYLGRLNVTTRCRYGRIVNRYNLALLLLTLAVIPLFYVSGWLGVVALIAIYSLVTRLANKDFDRLSGRGSGLHPDAVERAALHRPVPIIDPIERDEG